VEQKHKVQLMRATYWTLHNWISLFIVFFGLFNGLPLLAPLAAKLGLESLANAIYLMYVPFCHQMAQRSFFLFGPQAMYSPEQLPLALTPDLSANMLALKQFAGNAVIGWKVAWSDRMVYMYGATWFSAVIYAIISKRHSVKRLSVVVFALLMLPMALDGTTHLLSDLGAGGFLGGFRYTNDWLLMLTSGSLQDWFYRGDAFGSFNSWMRLISGLGFGIALVWLAFPVIEEAMDQNRRMLADKLRRYIEHQAQLR